MKTTNDLKRQAYIDQQLSLEETIELEESLTPAERMLLEQEAGFEAALADRLAEPVACPDELWERIQKQVEAESEAPAPGVLTRVPWLQIAAVLAVALIFSFALIAYDESRNIPAQVNATSSLPNLTVELLAGESEIQPDVQTIRHAMMASAINVSFEMPSEPQHHNLKLLGMRIRHSVNGDVAEINFSCCDKPIRAFVWQANSGGCSEAAYPIDQLPEGYSAAVKKIGNYKVMAYGPHDPQEILELFL